MKLQVAMIPVLALSLSLVGCGGSDADFRVPTVSAGGADAGVL